MRILLAASLTFAAFVALASPVSAAGPTPSIDSPSVGVADVAMPKYWRGHAGSFDCDADSAAPTAGILWVNQMKGKAQLWTDLKVGSGAHSETVTTLRFARHQKVRTGDFDGDGCSDMIVFADDYVAPKIWWGGPQGLKYSAKSKVRPAWPLEATSIRLQGGRDSFILHRAWAEAEFLLATGKRGRPFRNGKMPRSSVLSVRDAAFTDLVNGESRILHDAVAPGTDRVFALKLTGTRIGITRITKLKLRGISPVVGCGSRALVDAPGTARDREVWTEGGGPAQLRPVQLPGQAETASGAALPGGGCLLVRNRYTQGRSEIRLITSASNSLAPSGGSAGVPEAHPKSYLNTANRARLSGLLASNDVAAVRFRNMVDSEVGGTDHYGFEPWFAALMGQLTGDPKYCALAVERTESWVTGEEALINAGQRAEVAGDSYLEVGGHIGSLAMTFDWCYASLSASQRTRWINYANQAVWNVWHHEDATWGAVAYPWSGWSVDNPSNNYYYSFLRATMLLGLATEQENPLAAGWLTKFRQEKIGSQLVPTFTNDLNGGGSREGTGYGTAMKGLWELYDIWESSTGERIADLTPHTKASIPYLMHETVPSLDRIAPIGDHARDSTAALFDYHREYGLKLAWLYRNDPIAAPLRGWLAANSVPQMGQYFEYVQDFLYRDPAASTSPLESLNTTYYSPGAGDLFTRSSWATDATWMAMRMGPYTESHAHHDQLSFLINRYGWLAYDPNIDSHSGLVQDDEAHNLVRINHGSTVRRQREGYSSTVEALADNASFTYARADATALYNPANVTRATRDFVFLKPNVLVVYDRLNAGSGATFTWQLNSPLNPTLSSGLATFGSASTMRVRTVFPAGTSQSVVDYNALDAQEYSGGYRYEVAQSASGSATFLHVIDLGGALTSAVANNSGGLEGVDLTFANGGTANVGFNPGTSNGHMTLTGAAGSFDGALPTGIQSLPLFSP